MSEDYKIQLSGNMGEALVVIRGNNAQELVNEAQDLASKMAEIYEALTTVKQVTMVKEVFTAKKFGGNSGAGSAAPAAARTATPASGSEAKATPGGGFTCDHGPMKWLDYAKADGSGHVKGHYCQAPRGAKKCAPKKV